MEAIFPMANSELGNVDVASIAESYVTEMVGIIDNAKESIGVIIESYKNNPELATMKDSIMEQVLGWFDMDGVQIPPAMIENLMQPLADALDVELANYIETD